MKRGSLVGPLLIILIGLWFLLGSLRPDLPSLDVAARFWPFLLIAWGAVRLLELAAMAARRRPLPNSGISGGEWVLVVLITLIGSGMYAVNQNEPWKRLPPFVHINKLEMFGQGFDYQIAEQKAPAAKAKRLLVENFNGDTRIVGGDVEEVTVSGRKSVRALDEKSASAADRTTALEVNTQGDQIVIRTNQDRITGDERVSADLDITVPRPLAVELRGRSGNFEISGVNGAVEVSSDSGDVRLQDIGGNVRLDLRKTDSIRAGNVRGSFEVVGGRGRDLELENMTGEVTLNGSYSGDLQFRKLARGVRMQTPQTEFRVERIPGTVHMDLGNVSGSNLVGPIRLVTDRSRDVQLEDFTEAAEISVERGDIMLRPSGKNVPKMDVRARVGEIELRLPESGRFSLKGSTDHGEIINDFGPALEVSGGGEHRGAAVASRSGEGNVVTLTVDRGNITIRKDDGRSVARNDRPDEPDAPDPPPPPDIGGMPVQRH